LVALLFSLFTGLSWAFSLLPPPSSLLPVRLPLTFEKLNVLYALAFQLISKLELVNCFSFKSFENDFGVVVVIFCPLISKLLH